MVTEQITRAERLAFENARLRELLKRWIATGRRPDPAELERLSDDTKRALCRLGPGWVDDDED